MPENQAIQFDQVYYSVHDTPVLENITASFPSGKISTIIGPSGAGKSTVFSLSNGMKSPDSGNVFILNKAIDKFEPTELRRTVGTALQEAPMINGTVMDNLALPLTLRGERLVREKAYELLHLVGLDEKYIDQHVTHLSGGQKQKLSIARTLVNEPSILLLDEITSSLDRISQHEIEKLIKKINQKYKTTIIWITHNIEQAKQIAQFTWVMMDGRVVETGYEEVFEKPVNTRVKHFIRDEVE